MSTGIIDCITFLTFCLSGCRCLVFERSRAKCWSTRAVQKVSDLWPRKIHLHALRSATLIPFEVVPLWLNTLLPAVSPLLEAFVECLFVNGVQLGRRVPYNVVSWLNSSPFQLRFQLGKQPKITRSHVGRVGSLSNHRIVVFDQEGLNQLWGLSWCVVMMQLPRFANTLRMDKSSVKMECTEPVLIPTSSASSRTVTWRSCMTKVRTWSMSSSFRLVEGLPERASLSTDVRPSLNRLYHSLICVMPMASSPKTRWIFRMVSTWLLPRFWQNLMQWRCSSRSVIFAESNNATRAAYALWLTHWLHATDTVCWQEKKPRMCMKVPSTSLPQHTSRVSLVFAEKNHIRYFLNRPHIDISWLRHPWYSSLSVGKL